MSAVCPSRLAQRRSSPVTINTCITSVAWVYRQRPHTFFLPLEPGSHLSIEGFFRLHKRKPMSDRLTDDWGGECCRYGAFYLTPVYPSLGRLTPHGRATESIRIIISEYYRTKLNKWYPTVSTTPASYTCLSPIALWSDPGFCPEPSRLSKRMSEGPSSVLPLPDLDIGCDLVDRE